MKLKYLSAVLLTLILAIPLHAQSAAQEIEALLSTDAVTYAQAARFLLEASGKMKTSDPQEAFRYAMEQNWLPKKTSEGEKARLDGISKLLTRSFDMKGGVMYSITKNAHFSYRELVSRNFIQGRTSSSMNVSGRELLIITGRILSEIEQGD